MPAPGPSPALRSRPLVCDPASSRHRLRVTTSTDPLASVVSLLDEALVRFGTYAYEDRGPSEVMDTAAVTALVRAAGVVEAERVLLGLAAHPHGERLLDFLVMVFVEDDTWPDLTGHLLASSSGQPLVSWLL